MKKVSILLFTLFISSFAFSQYSDLTQGLGFAAGMPSGTGFSYRQMGEDHGFQITAGAVAYDFNDEYDYYFEDEMPGILYDGWIPDEFYTDRSYGNDRFWGNIGLTYYKPLHKAEKSLFYGFVGASIYYSSEKYVERTWKYSQETDSTYTYRPYGSDKELRETESDIFFGGGLGLTYNITNNIRFSLELPFTVSNEGHIWMIVPQGGLHYFFK
jgi:hypothetical protein